MPAYDGIEMLQDICLNKRTKDIPVIMLTASSDIDSIQKAGALDVKNYIEKPFMPKDLIRRVEKKLAEIHSEEILLIGDNGTILQEMRRIIEENFSHEALIASSIAAAEELLRTVDFDLIIASADMKFVDGFKIMNFIASDEKFSTIPFALTTSDKLLELVEKINQPEAEEPADKKIQTSYKSLKHLLTIPSLTPQKRK